MSNCHKKVRIILIQKRLIVSFAGEIVIAYAFFLRELLLPRLLFLSAALRKNGVRGRGGGRRKVKKREEEGADKLNLRGGGESLLSLPFFHPFSSPDPPPSSPLWKLPVGHKKLATH